MKRIPAPILLLTLLFPFTRIWGDDGRLGETGRYSLQEVLNSSLHGEDNGENTGVIQER